MNSAKNSPFNSPLESGVRSAIILNALFPDSIDMQRLVDFDYLVVHSGDAGGPKSLHAALPQRAGELLVRKKIIENGILLMLSRGMLQRLPTTTGIEYAASEKTHSFVTNLESQYLLELIIRARWVEERFGRMSDSQLKTVTSRFFDKWGTQFLASEGTNGS